MNPESRADPAALTIEIEEQLLPYSQTALEQWRDATWWASEGWRGILPEAEWHRVDKFRNQAAGGLAGYHFVEVLQMRSLAEQGLNWLYENFDFFKPPGRTSRVFSAGYSVIFEAYGAEKLRQVQKLAQRYVPDSSKVPPTPDLFAYRRSEAGVSPMSFIEVKRNDRVSRLQLLGLALIYTVFGTPVHIMRYVRPERLLRLGSSPPPRHHADFPALR